jgi:phosphorylcholine metabolism protein LicD
MNCDVDYVNKPEKYKCLGNTIDGNIFNKHNDQEKKTSSKLQDEIKTEKFELNKFHASKIDPFY